MLSSILNSETAIKMSIYIIDPFVAPRKLANNYKEILNKIQKIKTRYCKKFGEIYSMLQRLLEKPKEEKRNLIGFKK